MLLYEMKFLVPNYSCLQNPWLVGYRPQIPLLNPPPQTKFLGTPLIMSDIVLTIQNIVFFEITLNYIYILLPQSYSLELIIICCVTTVPLCSQCMFAL